jgi:hypothetical protein
MSPCVGPSVCAAQHIAATETDAYHSILNPSKRNVPRLNNVGPNSPTYEILVPGGVALLPSKIHNS